MSYFMRHTDKQKNSEVMGQGTNLSLVVVIHSSIHLAWQFWPFVTSQLYEPHPVSPHWALQSQWGE